MGPANIGQMVCAVRITGSDLLFLVHCLARLGSQARRLHAWPGGQHASMAAARACRALALALLCACAAAAKNSTARAGPAPLAPPRARAPLQTAELQMA